MTNSLTTKAFSAALAIVATTVSFAGVASGKSYEFSYTEQELADADSAAQLHERIADFARHACAGGSPIQTPRMKRQCREEMAEQLEAKVFGDES